MKHPWITRNPNDAIPLTYNQTIEKQTKLRSFKLVSNNNKFKFLLAMNFFPIYLRHYYINKKEKCKQLLINLKKSSNLVQKIKSSEIIKAFKLNVVELKLDAKNKNIANNKKK